MRACFAFAVCVALSVVGVSFGGESVSVLNHGNTAPTPAIVEVEKTAAVVVTAPAAVVVESAPCVTGQCSQPKTVCTNGQCARVYGVETYESSFHRHRLFGGTVTRNNTRTVVRPARR
jgi:hypothetical protein